MSDDKDFATAMIHLYRGELGRLTTYRVRLDTTTNWALGASAALVSYAFGEDRAPHFVLVVALGLALVFAGLEARRFQDLAMVRARVRCLESGFFAKMLEDTSDPSWRARLRQSLEAPTPPLTFLQAFSVRIRRNYLWLIAAIWVAWFVRLALAVKPFVEAAAIGPVSGAVVIGLSVVLFAPWFGIAFIYREHEHDRG